MTEHSKLERCCIPFLTDVTSLWIGMQTSELVPTSLWTTSIVYSKVSRCSFPFERRQYFWSNITWPNYSYHAWTPGNCSPSSFQHLIKAKELSTTSTESQWREAAPFRKVKYLVQTKVIWHSRVSIHYDPYLCWVFWIW